MSSQKELLGKLTIEWQSGCDITESKNEKIMLGMMAKKGMIEVVKLKTKNHPWYPEGLNKMAVNHYRLKICKLK